MAFYVGQKVVCVDDRATSAYMPTAGQYSKDLHGLRKDEIYTVRATGVVWGCVREAVWLSEITRPDCVWEKQEPGYAAARFRPVVERKTDISIFKAMLNSSDERVSA